MGDAKLKVVDHLISKVVDAWRNEGISPAFHRVSKQRLAREWPVLARAIDDLVRAAENGAENDALLREEKRKAWLEGRAAARDLTNLRNPYSEDDRDDGWVPWTTYQNSKTFYEKC